jgi:hypothetical protein
MPTSLRHRDIHCDEYEATVAIALAPQAIGGGIEGLFVFPIHAIPSSRPRAFAANCDGDPDADRAALRFVLPVFLAHEETP